MAAREIDPLKGAVLPPAHQLFDELLTNCLTNRRVIKDLVLFGEPPGN
jgi:hypothetical protein